MRFSDALTPAARQQLLGQRLRELRLERNIAQAEAAARAGVSRDAVQRAETGRGTVETLLRLLTAYGVADRLDLLLPEPKPTPTQLLEAERAPRRTRARRTAPDPPGGGAPLPWDDAP